MKQKIYFTIQVFTVLVLFLSIFVTSLLRERDRLNDNRQTTIVVEQTQEEDDNSSSSLFVPFTHILPQILNY